MNHWVVSLRWFLSLVLVLGGLAACGEDKGTAPSPPSGVRAAREATWAISNCSVTAAPSDSCTSNSPMRMDRVKLRCSMFMEGTWKGLTYSGSWDQHFQTWDDYHITGTLEATISPDDSLVTAFTVEQHVVWNLAPDRHRHETALVEYRGPGLELDRQTWGYIYRDFGTTCGSDVTILWTAWIEEDPLCTFTSGTLECFDSSSLHVGFYPDD